MIMLRLLLLFLATSLTASQALQVRPSCDACVKGLEQYVHLSNVLVDLNTIKLAQSSICESIKNDSVETCHALVSRALPLLASNLQDPLEICEKLSPCSMEEKFMILSEGTQELTCPLCELLVDNVKELLPDEATQEQYIAKLEETCASLPDVNDIKETCLQYLSVYGKQLVEFFEKDTENICATLTQCPSQRQLLPRSVLKDIGSKKGVKTYFQGVGVESGDEYDPCQTCRNFIESTDESMSDPVTQRHILDYLKKNCAEFVGYEEQCAAYVDLYGPMLLIMARKRLDPELCDILGLCHSHTNIHSSTNSRMQAKTSHVSSSSHKTTFDKSSKGSFTASPLTKAKPSLSLTTLPSTISAASTLASLFKPQADQKHAKKNTHFKSKSGADSYSYKRSDAQTQTVSESGSTVDTIGSIIKMVADPLTVALKTKQAFTTISSKSSPATNDEEVDEEPALLLLEKVGRFLERKGEEEDVDVETDEDVDVEIDGDVEVQGVRRSLKGIDGSRKSSGSYDDDDQFTDLESDAEADEDVKEATHKTLSKLTSTSSTSSDDSDSNSKGKSNSNSNTKSRKEGLGIKAMFRLKDVSKSGSSSSSSSETDSGRDAVEEAFLNSFSTNEEDDELRHMNTTALEFEHDADTGSDSAVTSSKADSTSTAASKKRGFSSFLRSKGNSDGDDVDGDDSESGSKKSNSSKTQGKKQGHVKSFVEDTKDASSNRNYADDEVEADVEDEDRTARTHGSKHEKDSSKHDGKSKKDEDTVKFHDRKKIEGGLNKDSKKKDSKHDKEKGGKREDADGNDGEEEEYAVMKGAMEEDLESDDRLRASNLIKKTPTRRTLLESSSWFNILGRLGHGFTDKSEKTVAQESSQGQNDDQSQGNDQSQGDAEEAKNDTASQKQTDQTDEASKDAEKADEVKDSDSDASAKSEAKTHASKAAKDAEVDVSESDSTVADGEKDISVTVVDDMSNANSSKKASHSYPDSRPRSKLNVKTKSGGLNSGKKAKKSEFDLAYLMDLMDSNLPEIDQYIDFGYIKDLLDSNLPNLDELIDVDAIKELVEHYKTNKDADIDIKEAVTADIIDDNYTAGDVDPNSDIDSYETWKAHTDAEKANSTSEADTNTNTTSVNRQNRVLDLGALLDLQDANLGDLHDLVDLSSLEELANSEESKELDDYTLEVLHHVVGLDSSIKDMATSIGEKVMGNAESVIGGAEKLLENFKTTEDDKTSRMSRVNSDPTIIPNYESMKSSDHYHKYSHAEPWHPESDDDDDKEEEEEEDFDVDAKVKAEIFEHGDDKENYVTLVPITKDGGQNVATKHTEVETKAAQDLNVKKKVSKILEGFQREVQNQKKLNKKNN